MPLGGEGLSQQKLLCLSNKKKEIQVAASLAKLPYVNFSINLEKL